MHAEEVKSEITWCLEFTLKYGRKKGGRGQMKNYDKILVSVEVEDRCLLYLVHFLSVCNFYNKKIIVKYPLGSHQVAQK